MTHYMGNPCKRGHSGKRYTRSGDCVECAIEAAAKRNKTPEVRTERNLRAKQPDARAKARARAGRPHAKARRAEQRRLQKYDLTPTEYNFMLAGQHFRCAICGADDPGATGKWHTDHCHTTDVVRGILCNNCNLGLGHFKDSPERLKAAIEYLCPTNHSIQPTSATGGHLKLLPLTAPNAKPQPGYSPATSSQNTNERSRRSA